jgi:hypothetical protein
MLVFAILLFFIVTSFFLYKLYSKLWVEEQDGTYFPVWEPDFHRIRATSTKATQSLVSGSAYDKLWMSIFELVSPSSFENGTSINDRVLNLCPSQLVVSDQETFIGFKPLSFSPLLTLVLYFSVVCHRNIKYGKVQILLPNSSNSNLKDVKVYKEMTLFYVERKPKSIMSEKRRKYLDSVQDTSNSVFNKPKQSTWTKE